MAAAHNDVLTAIYADLREVIRGAIAAELDAAVGARPHVDHARLVEAIRDRDGEQAAAEAQAHASSWEPGRPTGAQDRPGGPA